MGNHLPPVPGGFTPTSPLTSTVASQLQDMLVKSPNGDEGSTHNGSMRFGGVKAPHMTEEPTSTTTSGAGPHAITWDFDVAAQRSVKVATQATNQVVNVTLSNFRAGDRGSLIVKKMDGATRRLTVNFLGTNVRVMLGDQTVDNDAEPETNTIFSVCCFQDADDGVVAHVRNEGTLRAS